MPKLPDRLRQIAERKKNCSPPHLMIKARAGTGKTTTLVEGLKHLLGKKTLIKPSDEQRIIWELLKKTPVNSNVCFVAFGNAIARVLEKRVPYPCKAMTTHKMGSLAVYRQYPGIRMDRYRTNNLISKVLGSPLKVLKRQEPVLINAIRRLVDQSKKELVDEMADWVGSLEQIQEHYGIELGHTSKMVAYSHARAVYDLALEPTVDMQFDFNDMIWLPVKKRMDLFKYDLLLVDEAQDLNRCQQELVLMAGKRIVMCGDPKQAIFGFAGADCESMPRMLNILSSSENGCEEAELLVTRRCSKSVVKHVNLVVKDFYAHESNQEGSVQHVSRHEYRKNAKEGDMVLCRCNAPLVAECFKFLKNGLKANIQGRNVGENLIYHIESLKCAMVEHLIEKAEEWMNNSILVENAKDNPSEIKINGYTDQFQCLQTFCEGMVTVNQVIERIRNVFTDVDQDDDEAEEYSGILLASIHGAKGLESNNVYILQGDIARVPHRMANKEWELEQENNLLYVAQTRAIENLFYVDYGKG